MEMSCTSLFCFRLLGTEIDGQTSFVSAENASSQHLAYVDTSTNRAIIKVDNTTFVPYNIKRDSVRMSTQETWGIGTVWAIDVWHAPFGVRVCLIFQNAEC